MRELGGKLVAFVVVVAVVAVVASFAAVVSAAFVVVDVVEPVAVVATDQLPAVFRCPILLVKVEEACVVSSG